MSAPVQKLQWSDIRGLWRSLHPLLRAWIALLFTLWLVLAWLPFTNSNWWFAARQRSVKTRWDIARESVLTALDITLVAAYVWLVRKRGRNCGEQE
ncbi:MAG TPA: hypothetical protein VKT77_14310 [Chthonomonadaceae bacterium]|nr:hypothetical protein [Chthonomonadaceae bacterium]